MSKSISPLPASDDSVHQNEYPPTVASTHVDGQNPFSPMVTLLIIMLLIATTTFYICSRIYRLQARGVPPRVLDSIPIIVVTNESDYPAGCLICWEDFEVGQEIKMLPQCRHVFHSGCTTSWFRDHLGCPLCRTVPQ